MSIYDPTTIRQQCVEQHNALLEQAIATLTAKGCTVHPAKDAAEAAAILQELCTSEQKTMCTFAPELEEIQIGQVLPSVIQTDMEAVAAASLNRPFVNPRRAPLDGATQEEIVSALQQWLGDTTVPVNELMASISRKLKADADKCAWGITGADGIAADTGTLILAEDQGNGRIVSNIPTCHIAVVGLEKIYPSNETTLETVHEAWKAGSRQDAPVYYSYITGPSRTGDIEGMMVNGMHGPQQVHVILLDNGRSNLLSRNSNVMKCIECGRCTASLQQLTDGQAAPAPLTCKSLALANQKTPVAVTADALDALTFSCPVGITAEDLKQALN